MCCLFDKENSSYLKYKDIQVACIVLADEVAGDNCKNIAEIIDDSDINREEVDDRDSTPDTVDPDNYPGNDKEQDDNDYENLATDKKEFDLKQKKQDVNAKHIDFYDKTYYYVVGGNAYSQCIPYESNRHLLGTKDDCDEFYKTWK